MQSRSLFDTSPDLQQGDLSLQQMLAAQDKIPRENPDDTPDDERVALVMRFKEKSESSAKRKACVERWRMADRFIDGEQWDSEEKAKLDPHQANLTINRIFPAQETRVALMSENLVQVEVLPRDAADDTFAREIDGFLIHEWDRQGWSSVFAITLWQSSSHSTSFIKTYWDIHAEGGRGAAKLEPISNYDLFLHPKAKIREGKLVSKFIIHRFELTRNQILAIYNVDIVESPPETPRRARRNAKGDTQTSALLKDEANDEIHLTGRPSASTAKDSSRSPDYEPDDDAYEVLECWYMDDERIETEEFDDVERTGHKLKYPNGRIITVCNGRVLYDAPNQLGFFPFVPITERPTISEVYPPSTITQLIEPQKEYNKRRSQISDHAELCCNPIMILSGASGIEVDTHLNKPGARHVSLDVMTPEGGVWFLNPPPLGEEVGAGVSLAHQDIDEISGMHEVNRGEEPTQARSGVAIQHLQQSGKTRTSWHSDNNDVGLLQVYRNVISMYLDFVDEPRKYRFTNPESLEQDFGEFNPQGHILPNRQKRIQEIGMQIQELEAQKQFIVGQGLSQEETAEMLTMVEHQQAYLMQEIEIVEQMPASDLISFDIVIQTGTRHLSLQALASMAISLYEMNVITAQTLLQSLKFPGWQKAIKLKQEEQMALARAQQEVEEAQFERERQLQREKGEQNVDLEQQRSETSIDETEASVEGEKELQEEKHEDEMELERLKGEIALRVAKAKEKAKPKPKPAGAKK